MAPLQGYCTGPGERDPRGESTWTGRARRAVSRGPADYGGELGRHWLRRMMLVAELPYSHTDYSVTLRDRIRGIDTTVHACVCGRRIGWQYARPWACRCCSCPAENDATVMWPLLYGVAKVACSCLRIED
jgi:hypothetical protein